MSFAITVHTREGIVMAADSRVTLNTEQPEENGRNVIQVAVGMSDSNIKLFRSDQNIGIVTTGAAALNGAPLAGFIDKFIIENLNERQLKVREVAEKLLDFIKEIDENAQATFQVAGYDIEEKKYTQKIYRFYTAENEILQVNDEVNSGAHWTGETDVISRLIQPAAQIDKNGQFSRPFPFYAIPWNFFTLQDAIDFAIFAVRSTSDVIRFQPRPKTVGGPIDVLVIKPGESMWVRRKELHA